MIRVVIKLVLIFLVIYVATKAGYAQLEKRLLAGAPAGGEQAPVAGQPVAPGGTMVAPSASGDSPEAAAISHKGNDYGIIVTRNIFQAALEETKPEENTRPKIETKPPADTTLPLSLQGTIAGDEEDRAVIRDDKTKKQDIYRVGDSVNGALIKSIKRGKIILEVNGREEALFLEERKGGGPGIAAPTRSTQNRVTPRRVVRPQRRTSPIQPRRRLTFDRERIGPADQEEPDIFEPDEPLDDEFADDFPGDEIDNNLDGPEPPFGEDEEDSLDAPEEDMPDEQ